MPLWKGRGILTFDYDRKTQRSIVIYPRLLITAQAETRESRLLIDTPWSFLTCCPVQLSCISSKTNSRVHMPTIFAGRPRNRHYSANIIGSPCLSRRLRHEVCWFLTLFLFDWEKWEYGPKTFHTVKLGRHKLLQHSHFIPRFVTARKDCIRICRGCGRKHLGGIFFIRSDIAQYGSRNIWRTSEFPSHGGKWKDENSNAVTK